MINCKNFNHFETAYKELLTLVLEEGVNRDVRGFKTKEISPFLLITDNPLQNILINRSRKVNKAFMMAEWLWIMTGKNDVEMVSFYNKNIKNFSDDGQKMTGAYGPKIAQQVTYIKECFKKDLNTRQAVISIWERNPSPSKDVPCTLSIQFLHRDGVLDMIVNMRSNDLWLGLPYDFYTFTMFQNFLAMKLGLKIGRYSHLAGSLHLYDNHFDAAKMASNEKIDNACLLYSEQFTKDELSSLRVSEEEIRGNSKRIAKMSTEPWITMQKYFENKSVQSMIT